MHGFDGWPIDFLRKVCGTCRARASAATCKVDTLVCTASIGWLATATAKAEDRFTRYIARSQQ